MAQAQTLRELQTLHLLNLKAINQQRRKKPSDVEKLVMLESNLEKIRAGIDQLQTEIKLSIQNV